MAYSGFLQWVLAGDVARFYEELRWDGWEDDAVLASADQGFSIYPPPFAKQGKPPEQTSRRLVPISELCAFYRDCARQLAELPEGAAFRMKLSD
jgi:hypothetical protein